MKKLIRPTSNEEQKQGEQQQTLTSVSCDLSDVLKQAPIIEAGIFWNSDIPDTNIDNRTLLPEEQEFLNQNSTSKQILEKRITQLNKMPAQSPEERVQNFQNMLKTIEDTDINRQLMKIFSSHCIIGKR